MKTIPGHRGMSGDQFRSSFGKLIWWMLGTLNAPAKEVTEPVFPGNKKKIMNTVQDCVLAKVHFSPSAFNCFQLNP